MERYDFGWARRLACGLAVATCTAAVLAATLPAPASAATDHHDHGYSAEIRRTEYGIPHILAHDYGGLGYGYGYAFAQDNICQLADQVVTLRGERSRYFGPNMTPAGDANLSSDTYYQGLRQAGTVEKLYDRPAPLGPTPELRRMVEGYAAGYNRYLRDTGVAKLPDPSCQGKPWVGPITAQDIWNLVYDVDGNAGASGISDLIAGATPPAPGAAGSAPAPPSPSLKAMAAPAGPGPELGSNGWALGRDVTQNHDGMLLSNPHLPWTGAHRFYQIQLTIPGTLDVSGAALYGTPVVEIGHTQNLAWTLTTTFDDHASLYQLKLVPGDPTSYTVDGRTEQMKRQTVPVTVRGADGTLSTVTRTLYTSRYGPVISTGWTTTSAYTLRDANADNLRSMNEWLAMDQAQNIDQLRAAQNTYQGMPWTHTIATETGGTTYYTDSSAVPHLTADQLEQCAMPTPHDFPTVLDGSTAACAWGSDPDAIEPGLYGPSHWPTLTRTDYVANSNNGPYLTNPAAPVTGLPDVYNTGTRLSERAQLSLQMIAQRRDGTDGLGTPGFTLPTLQSTMLGNRNHSAELGRADVVALCQANPSLTATDGKPVDVRAACDTLAQWDTRDDAGSPAAALWSAFSENLGHKGYGYWFTVPYDPAQPLTTPRGINGADARVRTALADAVQNPAPGTHPTWAGTALPGCSNFEGCFNVVEGLGGDVYGSSFIAATELTPQGPRTRTILTYGESMNPASPHYGDQAALFAKKQWITDRFTEPDINTAPGLQTTTLHG